MPDILHRVGIASPAAKVYRALTTLDGLRGWWVSETEGNPGVGGTIDFGFCKMKVLEAVPGERVRWRCVDGPPEWIGTEARFSLAALYEREGKYREPVEFMHHCSTKWATFLLSLRDLVERGRGAPAPQDVKIHVGD